ncbi:MULTISPECIES: DUF433 domain-containing protein [unclassified Microcoleus]|uniref:DUF433 domain-containing protein n=1 Tax=unclassified Microcoleus TaxID=2642155 RepID=UPI002FD28685
MSYRDIITIEPDKRGGKPCIRRMRITVYDVLGWLASGMSMTEIIDDFPELTETVQGATSAPEPLQGLFSRERPASKISAY